MPPRITRGKPPKFTLTNHNYKKAKPHLLRDFQRRCAYSQQHTDRSLGERTMEIDHFNPSQDNPSRNSYENLFLSTRHCNGSKSNSWPEKSLRKKGIRFLNPCSEMDYGVHIFEHPVTHRLIGVTPAGDFHITHCDLNAPHLVDERKQRAEIFSLLDSTPITSTAVDTRTPAALAEQLREQANKMIPLIPYLPKDHPAYNLELETVLALNYALRNGF